MNNTINNNNTRSLTHNDTCKNLNIYIYYDIDYIKLSIMYINIRNFNHNYE